jgi:hypothetical protein
MAGETARAGMSHAPSPSVSICGFILPFCASCASLWLIFFICASAVSFSHFLGVLAVQPHPCPSVFYPPMSRPLRAGFEGVFCTQGVALVWVCRAPLGLVFTSLCEASPPLSVYSVYSVVTSPLRPSASICGLLSPPLSQSVLSHFLGVLAVHPHLCFSLSDYL